MQTSIEQMAEAQFTDIVGQTLTKHPGSLAGYLPRPQPTPSLTRLSASARSRGRGSALSPNLHAPCFQGGAGLEEPQGMQVRRSTSHHLCTGALSLLHGLIHTTELWCLTTRMECHLVQVSWHERLSSAHRTVWVLQRVHTGLHIRG